jgi:23S rRNA (pseudouridine1915-N3)-methyltransferase
MLNIRIVAVGKLKESYLQSACSEYLKRLNGFCSVKLVEIDECRLSDAPSQKEIEKALSVEAKAILKNVQGYVIALCIEGKQLGSVELSELVSELGVMGNSTISFVIGSSFGLSDEVKNKADLRLSMSKMTFPHQLARVMLLEQIYRVFQIAHGGKYHK